MVNAYFVQKYREEYISILPIYFCYMYIRHILTKYIQNIVILYILVRYLLEILHFIKMVLFSRN